MAPASTKQIARALLKKPKLLILDEATSALDNTTEAAVQVAIEKLMNSPEHTVIIIAHRLSSISNADCIVFMEDGIILECGSHQDLIAKPDGRYKRLFDSSKRDSTRESAGLMHGLLKNSKENVEEYIEEEVVREEEKKEYSVKRFRKMAKPDSFFILIGIIGAAVALDRLDAPPHNQEQRVRGAP